MRHLGKRGALHLDISFCLDEKLMEGLAEKSLWSQIPQNIRISKCFQSLCAALQLLLNQKAAIPCLLDCLQGSDEPDSENVHGQ